jgi:hypothetical protein
VESEATAVEPSPHRLLRRAANVALAMAIATPWAVSQVR